MTRKKHATVKTSQVKGTPKKSNAVRLANTTRIAKAQVKARCKRTKIAQECKKIRITIKAPQVPDLPAIIRELPPAGGIEVLVDTRQKESRIIPLLLAMGTCLTAVYVLWGPLAAKFLLQVPPAISSVLKAAAFAIMIITGAYILRFAGIISEKNFTYLLRFGLRFALTPVKGLEEAGRDKK
jgi:hypothetical protein